MLTDRWRRKADVRRAGFRLTLLNMACLLSCFAMAASVGAQTAAPKIVYVSDFELDAANIESDRGLLPEAPRGPLADVRPKILGGGKDPKTRARAGEPHDQLVGR